MVNYKPIPIPKMGGHPAQCHVPFGSSWSLLSRSHHQLSNWRFLHVLTPSDGKSEAKTLLAIAALRMERLDIAWRMQGMREI